MKYPKIASGLIALFAGLGLGGCGGGGGGTTSAGNTTVGVITGFGSVYVNGCEYETDSASISVEGTSASEDDLNVGDVVEVTGPANCTYADATSIKYSDELEGVVDSNSVTTGTGIMVIMGQDVTINDLTIFDDETGSVATVNDVATGHVVEISGFSIGTGEIVATRVEVKALSLAAYLATYTDDIDVKGVVTSHNGTTSEFKIGNLTVDYGSAILDDISVITDGLYVEVNATDYTAGSMTLVATKVEREDDGEIGRQGDDDEEFEIKGMLTAAYNDATKTFGINDQMVLVDNNTEYEGLSTGDMTSANLGMLYMEVEGTFNTNGVLVAEEVELEDDNVNDSFEVQGYISNLVATGTNMGTLTVGGTNLTVTNDTIMKDSEGDSPESRFNLTHLRDGDFIEVYYDGSSGMIIKLERDDAS